MNNNCMSRQMPTGITFCSHVLIWFPLTNFVTCHPPYCSFSPVTLYYVLSTKTETPWKSSSLVVQYTQLHIMYSEHQVFKSIKDFWSHIMSLPFLKFYCELSNNKTDILPNIIIKNKERVCHLWRDAFGELLGIKPPACRRETLTFSGFVFNWLFEESDVLKSAEEQNHLVVLVPDGSNLHVEPHWTSCRDIRQS